jgi:hypothetical protein
MTVASATVERSFSVLRCLKNYVRSTVKNDFDFEVEVAKWCDMGPF